MALVTVRNLKKHFTIGRWRKRTVRAVDGVSLEIHRGETLGLVGESGCGKTTVARCILGLIAPTSGKVFFKDRDITGGGGDLKALRQNMQIIFQDATGALNPRMKGIDLVLEPLRVHKMLDGSAEDIAGRLFEAVNLPLDLMDRFPHELSGGQRQRIGIARAISLNPAFVIADEAAASLDVLVQAQMVALLQRLQAELGIGYLYITHNLNLLRRMADHVAVMYLGKIVERGRMTDVFDHAVHPYTRALLSALPDGDLLAPGRQMILKGEMPSTLHPPTGCAFHPRCPDAGSLCREWAPPLKELENGRFVACHFA